MNRQTRSVRHSEITGELAALRRAARRALQIGLETETPVWVIKNGKMVDLTIGRRRTAGRRKGRR